jgi:hypothetical protein
MPEINFQLQHLNLPARDPHGLARWYARTFDLQADIPGSVACRA